MPSWAPALKCERLWQQLGFQGCAARKLAGAGSKAPAPKGPAKPLPKPRRH